VIAAAIIGAIALCACGGAMWWIAIGLATGRIEIDGKPQRKGLRPAGFPVGRDKPTASRPARPPPQGGSVTAPMDIIDMRIADINDRRIAAGMPPLSPRLMADLGLPPALPPPDPDYMERFAR
jgi:hypothetical protein